MIETKEPLRFVAEFRVLVQAVSPVEDAQRLREMVEAVEKVACDYGGELVINNARWLS